MIPNLGILEVHFIQPFIFKTHKVKIVSFVKMLTLCFKILPFKIVER